MEEIWKQVKGFEGRYEISNHGRIKSIRRTGVRLLTLSIDSLGYHNVSLRSSAHGIKRKCYRVHQLVAEHFLQKPITQKRLEIDHKDSNPLNNKSDNLRWLTVAEHRKITVEKGEQDIKGENHPQSKLTKNDVIEMRRIYKTENRTHKELAKMFNICRRQAGDIINGKNWAWL